MNEKRFVGPFAEYFTALVEEKRAQGYAYTERTRLLHTLDRMSLDYDCSGGLPKQLVLNYVTRQPHWSQATQESRVYTAHIAAVYLSRHGIRHISSHVLRHPNVKAKTKSFSNFLQFFKDALYVPIRGRFCIAQ